jgi:hypothetical protein
MKAVLLATAIALCATSVSYAQSLPNYGPNPPPGADSFGQPPTGYLPPGVSRYGPARAYAPPPNRYHRHRYHRRTQY